jgi:hypothetical protein
MVTTARYTQPELRHAMETLDDEVFYAVYRWIMENERHFEMMGVEMLGMTNSQSIGIASEVIEALLKFSQHTCQEEIKDYTANLVCFADSAVYALLVNVDKERFGAMRFTRFIYTTLTNALKRDLLENLYVLI